MGVAYQVLVVIVALVNMLLLSLLLLVLLLCIDSGFPMDLSSRMLLRMRLVFGIYMLCGWNEGIALRLVKLLF